MSDAIKRLREAENKGWMILCTSTGGGIYPDDLDAYNAIRDFELIEAVLDDIRRYEDGDIRGLTAEYVFSVLRRLKEAKP